MKLASVLEQVELSIKQVKKMHLCSGEEKEKQENFKKKMFLQTVKKKILVSANERTKLECKTGVLKKRSTCSIKAKKHDPYRRNFTSVWSCTKCFGD